MWLFTQQSKTWKDGTKPFRRCISPLPSIESYDAERDAREIKCNDDDIDAGSSSSELTSEHRPRVPSYGPGE